ncbi:MAG: MGMT family protein [Candidatus Levybacteria bacterium]|nr:MGMT family protein [Candidatus Levybacteria bacterium]
MNTFEKIYKVVSQIPKGKVSTYKKVAEKVGIKNARIVGFALHANKYPINVPCHRVVSVKGELTGYAFGGVKKKKEILKKEGVTFLINKVNLKLHFYRFPN